MQTSMLVPELQNALQTLPKFPFLGMVVLGGLQKRYHQEKYQIKDVNFTGKEEFINSVIVDMIRFWIRELHCPQYEFDEWWLVYSEGIALLRKLSAESELESVEKSKECASFRAAVREADARAIQLREAGLLPKWCR